MRRVEEVLAAHCEDRDYPDTCICETVVPDGPGHYGPGHYAAHVTEQLQPLIRQAQAEALREAADAWSIWEVFDDTDGQKSIRLREQSFNDWLRARAGALAGDA